jgi:hypothetical protein
LIIFACKHPEKARGDKKSRARHTYAKTGVHMKQAFSLQPDSRRMDTQGVALGWYE